MEVSLLLKIGLGLGVVGIRLMMVRNALRRAGTVSMDIANEVGREGLLISIIGLIVLLVGAFSHGLSSMEAIAIIGTGGALMLLGLFQLVQWTVQRGRGNENQVRIGSWVVTWIGVGLLVIYAVLRFIGVSQIMI